MICSTVGFVSCFCVPIACLCTMAQGSRAGKLKYLWEYSFQTSLYSSFCLFVPVPVRTCRIFFGFHDIPLATSSRRCWRTRPSPLPLPLPSPDLIHGLDLADAEEEDRMKYEEPFRSEDVEDSRYRFNLCEGYFLPTRNVVTLPAACLSRRHICSS